MVPDRQKVWTDGRRHNYIPPTSSGDIKCLMKTIRTLFNSKSSVQVLFPTGNSTNLIDGQTLYSFLKNPHNKNKDMQPPEGTVGQQLQEHCEDLKVLLVVERSLFVCLALNDASTLVGH